MVEFLVMKEYDDYRYDNNSRRTVRRSASGSDGPQASPRASSRGSSQRSTRSGSSQTYNPGSGSGILYDARGARVKKSKLSNGFVRTLLFFVIPYLIINGIIFVLVTAAPKAEIKVYDTTDYRTAKVEITTGGLLPIKDVQITMESSPLECEKDGGTYTAQVDRNGTVYVSVTSANGMTTSAYADVSSLDDTPPVIDDTSCKIEDGVLSFNISDTQSGVDYDSIYGTSAGGEKTVPMQVNKDKGVVMIPMLSDSMDIHFADMAGNAREAAITANEVKALNP